MGDAVLFLLVAFLAAMLLTGIHTYFGIHVLSRNIIFVDLTLAQISALGATVAFMFGYLPQSVAAYGYSLLFALAGAVILTFTRSWTGRISQEAFIGVIYVISAAAAFLLVDKAPQGAEHIKQLLVGSILTVTHENLFSLLVLYALIALFHWLFRKRFLLLSLHPDTARRQGLTIWLWDFLFYASFGIVVTSSVAVAGVLLVFSFLIIPAAIGIIYSSRTSARLLIGWAAGTAASAVGLGASYYWDLPTGAAMVCTFGVVLMLAAMARPWFFVTRARRRQAYVKTRSAFIVGILGAIFLSGAWLIIKPRADQPLLDMLEAWYPAIRAPFLSNAEREILQQAVVSTATVQAQAQQLSDRERTSRWQGAELSDEEVRKISSYVLSFQEMQKGEEFVQREIRNKARERQRWVIGIPLMLISLGLFFLFRR
jgi:zinc/manganese transport system permease protein